MKFSDQDLGHSMWMLARQIETVDDLIALWMIFPNEVKKCPSIERHAPVWFRGL